MRNLTLDEKISIKGQLAMKQVGFIHVILVALCLGTQHLHSGINHQGDSDA
jgi:hypothetical protein